MKLLSYVAMLLIFIGTSSAEMPDCYKSVNRVTWIVANVDHARDGWISLGMTDIHEYPETHYRGQYRGSPITILAREITGHLGQLTVDMIQPGAGQQNAFTDFLQNHGDGIFSIVHAVSSEEEMVREVKRMGRLGVNVLQQVTLEKEGTLVTLTYFDTAPEGKLTIGLIYRRGATPQGSAKQMVSHLAPVIHDSESVSMYWQKLGFPALSMEHATPREDSRYHGKPLWFAFEVGYQHYTQFGYEWIIPPSTPPNIYEDFLKEHGEGIQHIGIPVDDLPLAVAKYEKLGYHTLQSGAWGDVGKKDSGQYSYMDTDSIGGVSVELIHAYH